MSKPPWCHIHVNAQRSTNGVRDHTRTLVGIRSRRYCRPQPGGIQAHPGRDPLGATHPPGDAYRSGTRPRSPGSDITSA